MLEHGNWGKVLFVDCDGTMNTGFERGGDYPAGDKIVPRDDVNPIYTLGRPQTEQVARIINEAQCGVVLISVWRKFRDARGHVFRELHKRTYPFQFEFDYTEDLAHKHRSCNERPYEIQQWLDEHPEVTRFAILDDEDHSKMFPEEMFLCRCRYSTHFPSVDFDTLEEQHELRHVLGVTKGLADRAIAHLNQE